MPVVMLGPGFPLFTVLLEFYRFFGIFLGQNRAQRRFGSHALRQYTAPYPNSMALQTENTVGLLMARKERNSAAVVINVLIFFVVVTFSGPNPSLAERTSPG